MTLPDKESFQPVPPSITFDYLNKLKDINRTYYFATIHPKGLGHQTTPKPLEAWIEECCFECGQAKTTDSPEPVEEWKQGSKIIALIMLKKKIAKAYRAYNPNVQGDAFGILKRDFEFSEWKSFCDTTLNNLDFVTRQGKGKRILNTDGTEHCMSNADDATDAFTYDLWGGRGCSRALSRKRRVSKPRRHSRNACGR